MTVIDLAMYVALAVTYIMLLLLGGLTTLGKGRWMLFVAGIVVPPLWVVGATLGPKLTADEKRWVAAERERLFHPIPTSPDEQAREPEPAAVPAIVLRSRRPLTYPAPLAAS
ncbi:MAG: hypothetical protein OEV40_31850 [Acidimicrobiia bacterium]|nr:hypothetical protein [Acidimicrobiia bacterium]